jgi:hypothetical protein
LKLFHNVSILFNLTFPVWFLARDLRGISRPFGSSINLLILENRRQLFLAARLVKVFC